MVGTFRIGKVFGFEISIHWSWLLIFLLITWTFANSTLEEFYPDWTSARRWIVGSAVSIIFFLSILAHEMSHSIVARRYGIGVSSITLFVFGGVSNLTKEPENSRQEFWIAIVGPLASFLMALIFAIAWYLLKPIEEGAAGVAVHLAAINLAIGIFNLVPGFPLDGGRVLRSVFWARKRNIVDATRLASTIGQGVAFAIMALGGRGIRLGLLAKRNLAFPDRQLPALRICRELRATFRRESAEGHPGKRRSATRLRSGRTRHEAKPVGGSGSPRRPRPLLPSDGRAGTAGPHHPLRPPQSAPRRNGLRPPFSVQ